MHLNDYEQEILEGEHGDGMADAFKYQIALGEAFDAQRFVEVRRVHAPLTEGIGDTWFTKKLIDRGAKNKVIATTNPIYDVDYLESIGTPEPEEDAKAIAHVKTQFDQIGLAPTFSCIPQLESNTPRINEIVSFSESSAVPYVNGVLGARTNRESAKSALAAAITGRVPLYGLLLDENRYGDTVVTVEAEMRDFFDYRLLGYTVGKKMGNGTPVFVGLPENPSPESLLNLCADLNVSAAVAMLHIVGLTPEAVTVEAALGGRNAKKHITITEDDLHHTHQSMTRDIDNLEFAVFGCPHYTIDQVKQVASLLDGKHLHRDIELWVLTSQQTRTLSEQMGYLQTIENAGGHIMAGTCSVMPCWYRRFGGKTGVSDSAKAAFYNASQFNLSLMRLQDCIEAVLKKSQEM